IASVWFDWNQNGSFEPSEWTQITTNAANGTISFIVDPNAVLGNTLMRIRSRATGNVNTSTSACLNFGSGETEDYIINIIPGTPCTGTPTPGTAVSSQNTVCPGAPFNLSVTGILPTTTGLTYQWQVSYDGGNTYVNITGADSLNHHVDTGITVNTCFRRSISCGGNTAYSNWVCVTVNPVIFCPCSPNTGITLHSGTGPTIDSVSIPGTKLNNNSTGAPSNGYTLYNDTAIIPSLAQGANYILYTKYSAAPTWGAAWIDLNQDGAFDPSTEYFQFSVNGTTGSTTLSIPASATTGLTIMRIRIATTTYSSSASCSNFFSGETEDYVVNIIAGIPCSGAPIPGTAVSSVSSICPNSPFNLFITGTSSNTLGLTYQWQMSTDGGITHTDIAGADSLTHYEDAGITVNTCYRRAITCGTNTSYTNWVCVTVNPVILCPCGPATGTTLHNGTAPTIDSVSITGTVLNNNSTGTNNSGYTLYTDTLRIPTLTQGVSYTLFTKFSATPSWGAVWIDFNQDGIFDPSTEYFQFTINANTSSTTITIPPAPNSVTGLTLMRIRIASSTYAGSDACTLFFSGETEDYAVNISGGVVCSGPPTPGAAILVSPTILCANSAFTLDVSGATANQGNLTFQWQNSTDNNSYNDIPGETNPTYTNSIGITDSMYYRRTITCNGTYIALSTPILVKLSGALSTYPFVESFESLTTFGAGVLPNCWTTVATGTKFTSAATPIRNGKTARTGSNYVWAKYSSSAFLISPSLMLTGGQVYTFYYYYRPTDPTNGFVIKTYVGTAADTTSLKANQVGTTIYNPKDSSKWTLASFTYTPATNGTYYFAINSIAPVAPWYLMFDDINIIQGTLPVKMIQFKGEKVNTKNVLTWITTKEINNKGFEVQRSFNGVDFNSIGFVSSAGENGNSNGNLDYKFTDNQTPAGNNYYRLKQIDINGKESISEIVMIKGEKINKIEFTEIYPNPAKDKLSLILTSPGTQNLNIVLTDVSGRIIKEEKLLANEGNNQLSINVSSLQSGTYIIKAYCNNGCETAIQKFIKQ
ncbi:MAG: GEVED domain-containing protein, partial [Bacteroidota bacterium]